MERLTFSGISLFTAKCTTSISCRRLHCPDMHQQMFPFSPVRGF